MRAHRNFLAYKDYTFLYVAIALLLISALLYLSHENLALANGGTWQGYTLGTLATVLVLWLTALGARKRRYSVKLGSVQAWTSAHIYLGVSVVILATLHSGFQVGLNVHTMAYVALIIVVVSGIYGMYLYLKLPKLMSENLVNNSRSVFFKELAALNEQTLSVSKQCNADVQEVVESAVERTNLGGGFLSQVFAFDKSKMMARDGQETKKLVSNKHQEKLIFFVSDKIPRTQKRDEAAQLQELLSCLSRRQYLLQKIRRDIQFKAFLEMWLYIHVPITMALLVLLAIHILAVFFYW